MSGASTTAAWWHVAARDGFEVVFLHETAAGGRRLEGHVSAVEDGRAWAVRYAIDVDAAWRTRSASVLTRTAHGRRAVTVEADGDGLWLVDGERAPALDGCLDVDLEASAATNAFPVARLGLAVGGAADAPAAYVRVLDPIVERLEQRYARIADDGDRRRFRYTAPAFAFEAVLTYDASGLVVDYPGIAVRAL
jgi:uncharacterized protein